MRLKRITLSAQTTHGVYRVKASVIDIVPWAKTCVHRTLIHYSNGFMVGDTWTVSDIYTGFAISKDEFTRAGAIAEAKRILTKNGLRGYRKAVVKYKDMRVTP